MGMIPPRIVRPHEKTIEEDIEQLSQSIEVCKSAYEARRWNQTWLENMLRPYSPPEPTYEDMLFAPADWQKQEAHP